MRLSAARAAIRRVLDHAATLGAPPLGAIVLDAGGHPVAFARQDGASLFRFDIARAKATGALGMGADTRDIARRADANPAFFTSVAVATGGALALSAGGVLVRDASGAVIGAIGVSGAASEIGDECAMAGAAACAEGA